MAQNFLKELCMKPVLQLSQELHLEKHAKDYVRFSFAASQDNISNALENIKKMLG
jgi:aspartate/methionine/tyrosine aminotransferase